jgi:outer membrane lipoprotein-sorting protein
MRKFIVSFLLVLFCNASWASVDAKLVGKAEKYLNSITGLTGEFSQKANLKKDNGIFSMLRPGRVRLDYKSTPIQLISNGDDLFFYDKKLDQITTIPLTSTPAGILVRKNINLTSSDIVVSKTVQNKDTFSLDMHIKGNEGVGYMRVDFSNSPVKLKSWVVFDATGTTTSVSFSDLKTKTNFSKNYFQLQKHKTTSNSGGDSYYE